MARKNIRTSKKNKEITYKDVEKALEGRDLSNLSYKDMYELEQLGFGDWLKRNVGDLGMAVGGGVLAGVGALGSVFTGGASLAATSAGISMMGKGISGMSADAKEQSAIKAQNEATEQQNLLLQQQAQEQALFQRTAGNPTYGAVFAAGGNLNQPIPKNTKQYTSPTYVPEYKYDVRIGDNAPINLSKDEYDDFVWGRDYYNQTIRNAYSGRYQNEIDDFMSRYSAAGFGNELTPQGYADYISQNPNSGLPEISLDELIGNSTQALADRQRFASIMDRYVPRDYFAGANESNIQSVGDMMVAGRYYSNKFDPKVQISNPEAGRMYTGLRRVARPGFVDVYDYHIDYRDPYHNDDGSISYQNRSPIIKSEKELDDFLKENFSIVLRSPDIRENVKRRWGEEEFNKYALPKQTANDPEPLDNDIDIPKQAFGGYTGLPRFQVGGTINYEGQLHDGPDGGIPVDEMGNPSVNPVALTEGKEVAYSSDEGTYIFSDRLKYSDSKTFAQRAKDLQKKYELRAKTKGGTFQLDDPISKKGYDMEMQKLIGQQEQLKEMTMPQQQPQQMGYGELPMHDGKSGSSFVGVAPRFMYSGQNPTADEYYDYQQELGLYERGLRDAGFNPSTFSSPIQRPHMHRTNEFSELYNKHRKGNTIQDTPPEIPNKITPVGFDTTPVQPIPFQRGNVPTEAGIKSNPFGAGTDFEIEGSDSFSTSADTPKQQYQGMHWGQAALSTLPDVAAGITNLIRGGQRRRNNPYAQMKAPEVVAEQINLEAERSAAREQANVARANTSRGLRAGAPTAGSYMANMIAGETGIQRGLSQQLGQSYQNEAVTNAQMRQQAAMANQQMEMQARGYNAQMEAQNRAQADAMTGAGISQIGQGITGAYNQYAADRRHVQALNMQSPDYALYKNEYSPSEANTQFGRWIQNQYRKASAGYSKGLTPEGVMNQEYQRQTIAEEAKKYRELGKKSPDALIKKLKEDFPNFTERELIELFNQVTE